MRRPRRAAAPRPPAGERAAAAAAGATRLPRTPAAPAAVGDADVGAAGHRAQRRGGDPLQKSSFGVLSLRVTGVSAARPARMAADSGRSSPKQRW